MLRLRRILSASRPTSRIPRFPRGRFYSVSPKDPVKHPPPHLDDDRFYTKMLELSQQGGTRALLYGAITLVALGIPGWLIFGPYFKQKASKDATAAVTATIASEEVTRQVQMLSKDVVNSLLHSTETQQWTSKLSKAVVTDLINDPSTQEQVAKLLQQAVVRPDSTAALVVLLQDLVKQPATVKLVNDVAIQAVHSVLNDESVRQHASHWVQNVLRDEALQRHGGDAIWGSVTAALTPSWASWFRAKEEEGPRDVRTETLQGPEEESRPADTNPVETTQVQEEPKLDKGGGTMISKVRSWLSWRRRSEAVNEHTTLSEVPPVSVSISSYTPLPTSDSSNSLSSSDSALSSSSSDTFSSSSSSVSPSGSEEVSTPTDDLSLVSSSALVSPPQPHMHDDNSAPSLAHNQVQDTPLDVSASPFDLSPSSASPDLLLSVPSYDQAGLSSSPDVASPSELSSSTSASNSSPPLPSHSASSLSSPLRTSSSISHSRLDQFSTDSERPSISVEPPSAVDGLVPLTLHSSNSSIVATPTLSPLSKAPPFQLEPIPLLPNPAIHSQSPLQMPATDKESTHDNKDALPSSETKVRLRAMAERAAQRNRRDNYTPL